MLKFFILVLVFGFVINPLLRLLGSWAGYRDGSFLMSAMRAVTMVALMHWFYQPIPSRPELIINVILLFWFDLLFSRMFAPKSR